MSVGFRSQKTNSGEYLALYKNYKEDGEWKQKNKSLGRGGKDLLVEDECDECGEEKMCWNGKCASCLARDVWSRGKVIKPDRHISHPRFEIHRHEDGKANYFLIEFFDAVERDVKEVGYFDYVVEKEDFFHLYRKFTKVHSMKKAHVPQYLRKVLKHMKRDEA